MREAIAMADGHFLHLAHINSYCRGAINPELEEAQEAISLLIKNPNIYSESYISPLNGTSLACKDGAPISKVTCNSLIKLGFEATEAGMEKAFRAGKVGCVVNGGSESVRVTGEEGIRLWREHETELGECSRSILPCLGSCWLKPNDRAVISLWTACPPMAAACRATY